MDTNKPDLELFDEKQLARKLKVSEAALELWRRRGGGPPWLRVGKRLVRYDPAAVRKWIEEQVKEVHRG